MIEITFSEESVAALQALQMHPNHLIRRRALMLILKVHGLAQHRIARITNVCENTVHRYLKMYQQGGIEKLMTINSYKPQSRLRLFEAEVKEYFNKTPPATKAQACAEIAELTGVCIKSTQMRAYMKSKGIRYRKVSSIPAKADIEAQKKFYDEKLQPLLEEAQAGKRTVYFVDAAHFVLGAFLGYLWSFVRLFVKTPCGRQRFNVLGALNAITKELITITNDTYITSTEVCELLRKIAENATIPVTLVLDNARYQRCSLVTTLAIELKIELLFLPPYSPNLNLIERLWKLVKKECLYSVYYENFPLFRHAIQNFLNTMNQTHQEKLQSLLTLNFQFFSKEQFNHAV